MKNNLILSAEVYEKLQELHSLEENAKRMLVIKNVLESKEAKEADLSYESWVDKWRINELRVECYPPRNLWDKLITLRLFPIKGEYFDDARLELEIDENRVLCNLDDIVQFLKDVKCFRWIKGIEEIEEKFDFDI